MSYVVGFFGDDSHLGRTFHVNTMDEALLALEALRTEQQDVFRLPDEEEMQDDAQRLRAYFDDHCVLKTELGFYFVGSLENL